MQKSVIRMIFTFRGRPCRPEPLNIWFVLGPSGVGKTHFCEYLQNQHDWLHIDLDETYPPRGDGTTDKMELKETCNQFFLKFRRRPMLSQIRKKLASSGRSHTVLSFPSNDVLNANHIRAIKNRVRIVYLYGNQQRCLDAFLERERISGRCLDEEHWKFYNHELYETLNDSALRPWIIEAFQKDGTRKSTDMLYDEIIGLS